MVEQIKIIPVYFLYNLVSNAMDKKLMKRADLGKTANFNTSNPNTSTPVS